MVEFTSEIRAQTLSELEQTVPEGHSIISPTGPFSEVRNRMFTWKDFRY